MENVEQRITVFQTQSLPSTTAGIDRWIYNHAMDCLVWLANEIRTHIEIISHDERWYETRIDSTAVIDQPEIERFVSD